MALRRTVPMVSEVWESAILHRALSTVSFKKKIQLLECREGSSKQCVVLFSWLGANQRNSQKYVDCWTRRGHNVLLVKTSVRDLLCPKTGTNVTVNRVIDHLEKREVNKDKLIFHGLSVGGYLTQKVLMMAPKSFEHRLSHVIYDSFASAQGLEAGVLTVTPQTLKGIMSALVRYYTKMADLSSINGAQQFVLSSDSPTPTYFLHSQADVVAPYNQVKLVIDARSKYAPVETLIIPENKKIPHVCILKHLGEKMYMDSICKFIETHKTLNYVEQATPNTI